jgi:hypothetical protein
MDQVIPARPSTSYITDALENPVNNEASSSGVSWAAVIGGAVVTTALSLILLALGAGLGLSSVSVFSNIGVSSTLGAPVIVWLILMQIISSSLGGYLSGRLRTKWANIHSDEVHFRDTAHGFLAWAVALVVTAAFMASAAASMVGATSSSPTGEPGRVASNPTERIDSNEYFIDSLFRTDNSQSAANIPSERLEVEPIFSTALQQGTFSTQDKVYLTQLVAAKTGLSQTEADKRVSSVFNMAQQAAEATRKAIAHSLLWAFLALLIGAFCASFAATIGGRQRDQVVGV